MQLRDPQHLRERMSLMLEGIRKLFSCRSEKKKEEKPKDEDGTNPSEKSTYVKWKEYISQDLDYRMLLMSFHCILMASAVVVSYSLGKTAAGIPISHIAILMQTVIHLATLLWSLFFFAKFHRKTVEILVKKIFVEREKMKKDRAVVMIRTARAKTVATSPETATSAEPDEEPEPTEDVSREQDAQESTQASESVEPAEEVPPEKRTETHDQPFDGGVAEVVLPMPLDEEQVVSTVLSEEHPRISRSFRCFSGSLANISSN